MRRAHQVSTKFMEIANENGEKGEREERVREREREGENGVRKRGKMEKHSLGVSR